VLDGVDYGDGGSPSGNPLGDPLPPGGPQQGIPQPPYVSPTTAEANAFYGFGGLGAGPAVAATNVDYNVPEAQSYYFDPLLASAPKELKVSQDTLDVQQQLRDMLTKLSSAPSPYEQEAYKTALSTGEANLKAKYGADQQALNEEMARRGISASSITSGRMGDLAGQQARALATMQSELLQKAADQEAERQQVVMSGLGTLGGQMSQQDIQTYNANLDRYKSSEQFKMDAAKLQQDAKVQGQTLSLKEAADRAMANYQSKSLGVQLTDINSRAATAKMQAGSSILSSLLNNMDLSGFSPEDLSSIFSQFGITPPNSLGNKQTPNTDGGSSGGSSGGTGGSVDESYNNDIIGPTGWTQPAAGDNRDRRWNGNLYYSPSLVGWSVVRKGTQGSVKSWWRRRKDNRSLKRGSVRLQHKMPPLNGRLTQPNLPIHLPEYVSMLLGKHWAKASG
jgi:hypothetical protein